MRKSIFSSHIPDAEPTGSPHVFTFPHDEGSVFVFALERGIHESLDIAGILETHRPDNARGVFADNETLTFGYVFDQSCVDKDLCEYLLPAMRELVLMRARAW